MFSKFAHRSTADTRTLTDMTLADAQPGEVVSIVGHTTDTPASDEVTRRLGQLGFRTGADVSIIKRAPLGDPTIYRVLETELCLRKSEARLIKVMKK